jgi:uncharacterized protein involved in response to NO
MSNQKPANSSPVFFALGFRPFYLLAGIFALLALPMWIASYTGMLQWPGHMQGMYWHIHEMIFGFAPAVMAGFLLTAVRNWTGLPTPAGGKLAALVSLWVAARVLNFTGPSLVAMVVDVAFLPMLGLSIAIPIWRSNNRRNIKVLAVLAVLALANLVWHLASMGVLMPYLMNVSYITAIDMITILMAIVGGRVIPAFTGNAIPGSKPRHLKWLEVIALGSLVLIVLTDLVSTWHQISPRFWLVLLTIAALAHFARLSLWQPFKTQRNALLLMLPMAYLWIPVSLLLRAASQVSDLSPAAATHALTIGAMSSLMMAMMTRSALGHSGRALTASWVELSAFWLLQATAVVRVVATMLPMVFYRNAMFVSAIFWTLAFAIFVGGYWKVLTQPRVDGKPG